MKNGLVYLIKSEEGFIYVGSSNDTFRRLIEHNYGKSKYTKKGTGWRLVYFEEFKTLKEARKYEKLIKKSRWERDKFYNRAKVGKAERSSVG